MNKHNFLEIIEQSNLANHKEYLSQVLKPAIDILRNTDVEPRLGWSRMDFTVDG